MNTPNTSATSAADQMKAVKVAWDKAPAGPKKDIAHKHYVAAEKAMAAKNDVECIRELELRDQVAFVIV